MSHAFLGALLDEYEISSPENYFALSTGEKDKFLKRLNFIAINDKKRVLKELKENAGLKMHFNVSRHPQHGWQNLPNETFAKKLAFFSGKTIITFPFHEISYASGDDLNALLSVLCMARPFLEKDWVNIFPSYDGFDTIRPEHFNKQYGLISANFHRELLEHQFEERLYNVAHLLLPTFKNIEATDVVRIREEEASLYNNLEIDLASLLNGDNDLDNEDKLIAKMREIHVSVKKLTEKFEDFHNACLRRDIYTVMGFATVTLVALFPPTPVLAGILAGAGVTEVGKGVWDILTERVEDSKAKRELKDDECYLFWRINHESVNKK